MHELEEECERARHPLMTAEQVHRRTRALAARADRRAELAALWQPLWRDCVVRERVILPRLLERCPDLEGRVALWTVALPVFGGSVARLAHTSLLHGFLSHLGVPDEHLPYELARDDAVVASIFETIEGMSLAGLLVYGCLAPAGPAMRTYPVLCRLFEGERLGVAGDELEYFRLAARQAEEAIDTIRGLVQRYAAQPGEQREVVQAIELFHAHHPLRDDTAKHRSVATHLAVTEDRGK